ncbi:MAG: hypothetical protein Kow0098_24180 [Ignavibacteriaceae bacterium]
MNLEPGNFKDSLARITEKLKEERIVERIWQKDYTIWSENPDEISNRLGWLHSPEFTLNSIEEINSFVQSVLDDGFTDVLLMGMGGSSLAPEVFSRIFETKNGYLNLHILDSTHPEAVIGYEKKLDLSKTLFIVSTKSGGTVETISFMKYFYNVVSTMSGKENAGKQFAAVTDPGSGLEQMAGDLNFRKIFLNDPDIGGRYSALSFFGMVPAALIGVDLIKLLNRASEMVKATKISGSGISQNSAAILGLMIGQLACEGRDKITLFASEKFSSFGAWIEQLIAESTGKSGKGILPVDLEPVGGLSEYSKDRIFVFFKLSGDPSFDNMIDMLKKADHPVIEIDLNDLYALGKEFFRWEFATAVAGWVMNIQPFDQPNVEQAKVIARNMMKEYRANGKLPELSSFVEKDGVKVYNSVGGANPAEMMQNFLSHAVPGKSYVAIQAYLKPDPAVWEALQNMRRKILKRFKVATTLGYGPRFLHSTGQLHKGDAANGLFIQIIADAENDLPIPDEAGSSKSTITFGVLIKAQALGDRQALLDNGRKVITVDLGKNVNNGLSALI